jgi:hypothetical protein
LNSFGIQICFQKTILKIKEKENRKEKEKQSKP